MTTDTSTMTRERCVAMASEFADVSGSEWRWARLRGMYTMAKPAGPGHWHALDYRERKLITVGESSLFFLERP